MELTDKEGRILQTCYDFERDLRERLSISTLCLRGFRSIGTPSLRDLANIGFQRIELLESPEQFDFADPASMQSIFDALSELGITIGAYHADKVTFGNLEGETDIQKEIDRCRKQIDTMVSIGGNIWGCHAGPNNDIVERCLVTLADHVRGSDIYIAIENFTKPGTWVEDRVSFLDQLNHPNLGMILDIGHVRNSSGLNPLCFLGGSTHIIDLCKNHLCHLHLHGFVDGHDHHPPFSEGDEIGWKELITSLYFVEYKGWLNFEPNGPHIHPTALSQSFLAPTLLARHLA